MKFTYQIDRMSTVKTSVIVVQEIADAVVIGLDHEIRLPLKNKLLELNRWEYVLPERGKNPTKYIHIIATKMKRGH